MPKNKVNQQIKRIFHEDWVSQHRLARQNGIGKSYVSRIINKEKSIKNRKKKKAPKHSPAEAAILLKCLRFKQLFS